MDEKKKKQWIKPELIVICESEINENLLGSGGICFDNEGNPVPCP